LLFKVIIKAFYISANRQNTSTQKAITTALSGFI
jgi:hypothetical protein